MLYLAAAFFLAAIPCAWIAFTAFKSQHALQTKAGPLGQAQPGRVVHLMGRVVPQDDLLVSPAAGRECVYYRHFVEVYHPAIHTADDEDHSWTEVLSNEEDFVDFVIEDATGRVKVQPKGARFILEKDLEACDKLAATPGELRRGSREVRTEKETFIEVGDLVRVIGYAKGSPPRADTPNPTMVVGKAGSPVFVITDKPKGAVVEGFSMRGTVAAGLAAFLLLVALFFVGARYEPNDPIIPDTRLKPVERMKRPAAD